MLPITFQHLLSCFGCCKNGTIYECCQPVFWSVSWRLVERALPTPFLHLCNFYLCHLFFGLNMSFLSMECQYIGFAPYWKGGPSDRKQNEVHMVKMSLEDWTTTRCHIVQHFTRNQHIYRSCEWLVVLCHLSQFWCFNSHANCIPSAIMWV